MEFVSDLNISEIKNNFSKRIVLLDMYDWLDKSSKSGEMYGYIHDRKIIIVVNPSFGFKIERKYCFSGYLVSKGGGTILKGNIRPIYTPYMIMFCLVQFFFFDSYLLQSMHETILLFFVSNSMLYILYSIHKWLIQNIWSYASRKRLLALLEECLNLSQK